MSGYRIARLPWLIDTTGRPVGVRVEDGTEVMLPSIITDAASPASIIVSAAAPNNGDGRPDGTIYIQTA